MFQRITFLLCAAVLAVAGAVVVLGAAGHPAVEPRGGAPAAGGAVLRAIASAVDARTGTVTLEASEPVAYTASQPDARTFVVELRGVDASGVAERFAADPRHPVTAVTVERARAQDGASLTRVRLALAEHAQPRARSYRNLILVETARRPAEVSGRARISTAAPASVIRDIRASRRGTATVLTMYATGPLQATTVAQPMDGPARLELDLPNASSSLPQVVPVSAGPVERVRLGLNPRTPLATHVVLDLNRRVAFRIEHAAEGRELALVFDEPVSSDTAPAVQPRAPAPAATPTVAASASPAAAVATVMARLTAPGPAPAPRVALPVPAPIPAVVPARLQQGPQTAAAAAPMMTPMPPMVAAPALTQCSEMRQYTGHPVSLDFQNADLRAVLRAFAEISGLNVVIDPGVQGSVDVALRDVPWDQALSLILRANKLDCAVDGGIVRVATTDVFRVESKERKEKVDAAADAGELEVLTRVLSYAKAEDVAALAKTLLSQRGQIQTDPRTNTIIINDLPDRVRKATALLTTLDQPQPQVEIEARIVQTTREFARTLGVQWGIGARASQALGNTLPLAFPNQGSITGRTTATQGAAGQPEDATTSAVNLGVQGAASALGLALGSVNGALNLDVALSALERQGQGRLLSTPRVSTQNNVEAEITQGVQVPIQTVANNTVTVTFKDAALTLKVTPQITAANTVIMRISVENASPDFSRSVNNIPPIDTQRAVTQVLVTNGETTVIGGIYVSREQSSQDRTPGLHRLPLLGWLFKRDGVTDESRELLIFITPRIVRM